MMKNLLKLRNEKGISQKTLCEELKKYGCCITRSAYTRYENGSRNLPCEVLIALAVFHGTTTDYILGLTDKQKNGVPSDSR